MNLDELFHLSASDVMVASDPLLLAGCALVSILLGWYCVHRYRNTNDFQKSTKLFVPLAVLNALIFLLPGVPLLFAVGCQLCGFVCMAWISNYYFYH